MIEIIFFSILIFHQLILQNTAVICFRNDIHRWKKIWIMADIICFVPENYHKKWTWSRLVFSAITNVFFLRYWFLVNEIVTSNLPWPGVSFFRMPFYTETHLRPAGAWKVSAKDASNSRIYNRISVSSRDNLEKFIDISRPLELERDWVKKGHFSRLICIEIVETRLFSTRRQLRRQQTLLRSWLKTSSAILLMDQIRYTFELKPEFNECI